MRRQGARYPQEWVPGFRADPEQPAFPQARRHIPNRMEHLEHCPVQETAITEQGATFIERRCIEAVIMQPTKAQIRHVGQRLFVSVSSPAPRFNWTATLAPSQRTFNSAFLSAADLWRPQSSRELHGSVRNPTRVFWPLYKPVGQRF